MRPLPLLLIAAALLLAGCGHHSTAPAAQPEQVGAEAIGPATVPSAAG